MHQQLIRKLQNKSAIVAIVGMGYVGLPLALRFSEVGYKVMGIDIDQGKVDRLNLGESYIRHIKPASIAAAIEREDPANPDFVTQTIPKVCGGTTPACLEAGMALYGHAIDQAVKGSRILVLGIAYKKNVDDMRESPSVILMELLRDKGAEIAYSDPHVPVFPRMREHHFDLNSTALTPRTIGSFDCVAVATNHDAFDYALVKQHARLIVDTRGVYLEPASNVVKA